MIELSDFYIIERMREARKTEFEPKFSLQDLVGKTIQSHRQIRNPKEYDSVQESPNPEYFDVLIFKEHYIQTNYLEFFEQIAE